MGPRSQRSCGLRPGHEKKNGPSSRPQPNLIPLSRSQPFELLVGFRTRDGLAGVKLALEKRGMELTAEGTFERNTRAVGSALRTIKRAEPEAVVMTPCCRRAGEHRTESDTRGYAPDHQRRRKFRHQRNDHDLRVEDARRSQQGLSHGDSARRDFQGP